MAYKILAVVGFATMIAMASATAATEEVRVLEAKLAAAKAKFAAEQNSVQAEGNKRHIRADTGSRAVRETETIFTLTEKVKELDALMTTLEQTQEAQLATVPGSVNSLEISVNAAVTSVSRADALTSAITDLDSEVDQIPNGVKTQTDLVDERMVKLQGDMGALSSEVTAKNAAALKAVDDKIAASKRATDAAASALSASVTKSINSAKATAEKASGDVTTYTHWGSNTCTGPGNSARAYAGWTYASHHGHQGGTTPQCLINAAGDQGGRHGGWDSLDLMYATRTDHCSGTTLQSKGVCNKNIPCAVCTRKVKCYLETGTAGCSAEGFEAQYKGWVYGAHEGHNSIYERICIDPDGTGYGPDNGSGSLMYPSLANNGIKQRAGDQTTKCTYCCLK